METVLDDDATIGSAADNNDSPLVTDEVEVVVSEIVGAVMMAASVEPPVVVGHFLGSDAFLGLAPSLSIGVFRTNFCFKCASKLSLSFSSSWAWLPNALANRQLDHLEAVQEGQYQVSGRVVALIPRHLS